MRLGKDAIIFTKSTKTCGVGFFSQTFLTKINADSVLVPIVNFDIATIQVIMDVDTEGSFSSIIKYSLFRSKKELVDEIKSISGNAKDTGTKIIVYNLKKGGDGKYELDFESNLTVQCETVRIHYV